MHHQYFSPEIIARLAAITHRDAYGAGVAFAIAGCLQLPSAPVDSPETFFVENLSELATKAVMVFNETRALDWDETEQMVRQAWMARYAAVYSFRDNMIALGVSTVPSLLDLFGAGAVLPVSTIRLLIDKRDCVLETLKVAVEAIHNHKLI